MEPGEEISVDIEEGKTLIIKFLTVGDPHLDGRRLVFFELNGQPREVPGGGQVAGRRGADASRRRRPAIPSTSAPRCPAWWCASTSPPAKQVAAGQKLVTLEAMKMETTVYAERAGRIAEILVRPGTQVEAGDLMLRLEA